MDDVTTRDLRDWTTEAQAFRDEAAQMYVRIAGFMEREVEALPEQHADRQLVERCAGRLRGRTVAVASPGDEGGGALAREDGDAESEFLRDLYELTGRYKDRLGDETAWHDACRTMHRNAGRCLGPNRLQGLDGSAS